MKGRKQYSGLECRQLGKIGTLPLVIQVLVGTMLMMIEGAAFAGSIEPPTALHQLARARLVQVEAKQSGGGRFVMLLVQNRTDSVLSVLVPFGTGLRVQEESVSQIFLLEESERELAPRGFSVFLFPSTVLDLPFSGLDETNRNWDTFFHHGVGRVLHFVDENWSVIGDVASSSYGDRGRDRWDLFRLVLWLVRGVDRIQMLESWMALGDSPGEAEELLAKHILFAERVLRVYLLSRSK